MRSLFGPGRASASSPIATGAVFALLVMFGATSCRDKTAASTPKTPPPDIHGVEHIVLSGPINGEAYVIPLDSYRFRVLTAGGRTKRRPVDKIVRAHDQVVATNGSFFDTDGSAMGLVVDEGRLINDSRVRPWGALVIDQNGARIVKGGDVDLKADPDVVIQGQPRLVQDGTVPSFKAQKAKRTVVCLRSEDKKKNGDYDSVTLVVTAPITFSALAAALKRKGDGALGCHDALNLDGGPSTQLVARLTGSAHTTPGGDAVPNALVALPRIVTAASEPSETAAPANAN